MPADSKELSKSRCVFRFFVTISENVIQLKFNSLRVSYFKPSSKNYWFQASQKYFLFDLSVFFLVRFWSSHVTSASFIEMACVT